MIYIGIDIAKNSHFASAVNSDGEVLIKPFSFENSRDGFNLFLNKFKGFSVDDCLVGLESTGHYGDNLICFLFPKGFSISFWVCSLVFLKSCKRFVVLLFIIGICF